MLVRALLAYASEGNGAAVAGPSSRDGRPCDQPAIFRSRAM